MARVRRDRHFREALFTEAINAYLASDTAEGKAILRDLVNATIVRATSSTRPNRLRPSRIVSALFTLTPDLSADFPARAAREAGWRGVPMLCAQEIPVPGAPRRICRVLVHASGRGRPRHVYLGAASALRPDLEYVPAAPSDAGRRHRGRKRAGAGTRSPVAS